MRAIAKEESSVVNDTFERVSRSTLEEVEQVWSMFRLPGPASLRDLTATEVCDQTLLVLQHDIVARKANALSPVPSPRNKTGPSSEAPSLYERALNVFKEIQRENQK